MKKRQRILMISLLAPALFILMLVMLYPLINSFVLSFYRYMLTDPQGITFIGWGNYVRMFNTVGFWIAFRNTLVYVSGLVFFEFVIGFSLALLLNLQIRCRAVLRGFFMIPWIIPSVAIALLTMWLFNPDFGVVNVVLRALGVISQPLGWLKDPSLAMPTVLLVTVWKFFPFMLVVLLAGLQTIPEDEIDSAKIDGANPVRRFIHITLPHMREIIMIVTLLEFIWSFQYITIIWITTKGGPVYATTTFPVKVYEAAFQEWNLGFGASIGVFWILFLLVFSILFVRVVGGKAESKV